MHDVRSRQRGGQFCVAGEVVKGRRRAAVTTGYFRNTAHHTRSASCGSTYFGRLRDALPIERAAADFAAERVAGFDTETRPAFRVRALAGGARRPGAVAQGEGIEQSGSAKRARA